MSWRLLAAALIAASVGGCAEPVKPIKAWTAADAASASIASITVVNRSTNATPENIDLLKSRMQQFATSCTRGPNNYEMQLSIDNFKVAGTLGTVFGDVNELAGEIKVIDPATKAVAAEYYVQEKRKTGGVLAAAAGVNNASEIVDAFTIRVCTRVLRPK
jgi:hypothetical protein